MNRWIFLLIAISSLVVSCGKQAKKTAEKPLARVYDHYLYPSSLKGMLKKNMSVEDSTLIVGTYIENWAKNNLMLHVAEENVPKSIDIEKMVQEYRKSLIKLYYEKNLVQQRLDTLVNSEEISSYYELSKGDHILKYHIASCFFVKIPTSAPDLEDVKKWWKMEDDLDMPQLKEYCEQFAQIYILEDSTWIRDIDLAAQFPDGTFSEGSLTKGKTFNFQKKGYLYLMKVNGVVKKGKIAPIGYIREKAKDYILLKRKRELIDHMADEMYQREINKKNVVIYN